ncbi:MAG: hypothetical protein E6J25_07755 [Chloroflexi bacterium]|nr:MAG: hypothetical protein E6J25_07755 [Chloroflexota bacterium]TME56066.1 MAG: hypothetical protein E6I60_04735 [Chloroflexota bacterium]
MTGLLAQTNAYIRDAERQHRDHKARQDQVRRPVQLIDRLLQELEEMNLKGMKRVPTAYEPRLDEVLTLLSPIGSMPQLANIKVKVGIPKLMDALFAVEEALFAERHGPVAESDGEPFNSGLFTAA